MPNISPTLERARAYEREYLKGAHDGARPVVHLTPPVGWMNDPNGFCHHDGRYHLFFQYNPYDTVWGPMHWGHASSEDMLRWRFEPCALAPDTEADAHGCFSGSAVSMPDGRLLLVYTGVRFGEDGQPRQTQCVALGDGIDFVKHPGNPVIPVAAPDERYSTVDFRNPKAWREPDGSLGLVVSCRHADKGGTILRYTSGDGLCWQPAGEIDSGRGCPGPMLECPDLFPLDGGCVLLVSAMDMTPFGLAHGGHGSMALIGRYDAEAQRFTRQSEQPVDLGQDFYAPQTILTPDGRRVMIGWMESWDACREAPRHHPWYGAMTLPRELTLREGKLWQQPVRELERLWRGKVHYYGMRVMGQRQLPGVAGRLIDLSVALRTADGPGRLTVCLSPNGEHPVTLTLDAERGEVRLDRTRATDLPAVALRVLRAPAAPRDGKLSVRAVVDRESIEVFINGGERAMTARLLPDADPAIAFAADTPATVDVQAHPLAE